MSNDLHNLEDVNVTEVPEFTKDEKDRLTSVLEAQQSNSANSIPIGRFWQSHHPHKMD